MMLTLSSTAAIRSALSRLKDYMTGSFRQLPEEHLLLSAVLIIWHQKLLHTLRITLHRRNQHLHKAMISPLIIGLSVV